MVIEIEEPSGFAGRGGVASAVPIFESPEDDECGSPSPERSTTTTEESSIGNNSDLSATEENDGENEEVQSAYKGSLDSMEALEEVLPIRRGISKFYNGKSKSFTSLAEAASSVKEIVKPENAYSRRRRNLLAFSHVWGDRSKGGFPYQRSNGGVGISKRPVISSSRSQLALAVAMSSSESISSSSSEDSYSGRSPPRLPPLHPRSRASHNNLASFHSQQQDLSPWRSYSVVDLHQSAIVGAAAETAVPTIIQDH